MKTKPLTYVLGALVTIIWGVIFLRVFQSWGSDNYEGFNTDNTPKMAYNDYSVSDTSSLNLNYNDPFRLTNRFVKTEGVAKVRHSFAVSKVRVKESHSFITYSGYIRRPGASGTLSMLNANGRSVLIAEGEVVDGVRLLKNLKDSIKVLYKGSIKYIALTAPD